MKNKCKIRSNNVKMDFQSTKGSTEVTKSEFYRSTVAGSCFMWSFGGHVINGMHSGLQLLPYGFIHHSLPIYL